MEYHIFIVFLSSLALYILSAGHVRHFTLFAGDCCIAHSSSVILKLRSLVDCGLACTKTWNCSAFILGDNSECGLLENCLEIHNITSTDQETKKLYCLSSKFFSLEDIQGAR